MNTTKIVELVIDEDSQELAIDAISLVSAPAIEENWVFFGKEKNNLTFAKVDEEKRMLVSPALIPNKQIFRYDPNTDSDYYVYFSKDTVRKCSELFLKNNNHHKATHEHNERVSGVLTVESWIIEDPKMDKSTLYGFSLPKGTWMVMLSISNDDLWSKIKSGELKGLSIEGYFTNKFEQMQKKEPTDQQILSALNEMIQSKTELKAEKVELGAIDDLKKFNDEARKLIEVLSQGNTDVSEEYQLVKNKARDYNRLNKSYRDDVKKGKAAFKNLKGSISEVEKAVKELGLKPNDIPEFSSSSRALDVLRGLSMDAVNYPDIEI